MISGDDWRVKKSYRRGMFDENYNLHIFDRRGVGRWGIFLFLSFPLMTPYL